MMDKTAPADHNPVFVLNKKDIEETLKEPRVIISRVDSEGDKLKVYMHIVDGENLLTGAEGMKEIFCTTIDEMNGNEKILNNFTIKEISEETADPASIVVVMDHSGSMGDQRARVVQEAVKRLIENKRADDQIALIRYDAKVSIQSTLNDNKEQLLAKHQVNGLQGFGGLTATTDAIVSGIGELDLNPGNSNEIILVFADGEDNSSQLTERELLELAAKSDVNICTIDYGYYTTEGYLENIANRTGGIYHHIYYTNEFDKVFDDLYNRINNYYVVELDQLDYGQHNLTMKICLEDTVLVGNYSFNNTPLPGSVTLLNVYFDTGKSTLKGSSKQAISRLINLMKYDPEITIEIHGHTDNVGKAASNQTLSENRALSVKKALQKEGISPNRIKTFGWGDSKPVESNDTKEGRAKNRRTEFIVNR